MSITPEDIREILKVLDDSPYDELKLDLENVSLQLRRSNDGSWTQESQTAMAENTVEAVSKQAGSIQAVQEPPATETGLVDIRAPMVGTFYRSPKPGADPFVSEGSTVSDNTVIAIIEVMKLMNSVSAKVSGEVVEILVEDATLIHKDQLLMRVRP